MKKKLFSLVFIVILSFLACNDGNMKYIITDQDGYAEDFFIAPENGKIKITSIDSNCNEINKGGRLYKTHYYFTIRDMKVLIDVDCDNFIPTDYFTIEKGDKIKMVIKHGEANTRYKITFDFINL